MGDDGKVLACDFRQREDATDGRQLFAREATDDSSLTEQSLYGRVARCDGTGVRRGGTASALT